MSFIAPEQSFHRAGLVGFASKGPVNVPTLISTHRQLTKVFGYPHPESGDPYLIYAAEQYLLVANELYIVRVAQTDAMSDESAKTAHVDVPSAGGQIIITSTTAGPYVFATDSFFRWRLNGVDHSKTLVVLAGTYTAPQLAVDLNLQVDPLLDGISFTTDPTQTKIAVQTTWAFGPNASLEFVSIQSSIYGGLVTGGNVTGLGTGMTQAQLVGTASQYPLAYGTAGVHDLRGLTGLNIQLVVDGTDNVLVDNVVQTIDLTPLQASQNTITQVVNYINSQKVINGGTLAGGWTCYAVASNLAFKTDHFGRDARLLVKSTSTAAGIFGLANVTVTGLSPVGVSTDPAATTFGLINGSANATGAVSLTIKADSAGIDGNSTQVVVESASRACPHYWARRKFRLGFLPRTMPT